MAAAAKTAGLRTSSGRTLPDTREHVRYDDDRAPTLHGGYKVPHFDSKGEADAFFTDAGVPTTFLSTTMYFETFLDFFRRRATRTGRSRSTSRWATGGSPESPRRTSAATAFGIFEHGTDLVGRTVAISGENLTGEEYAARARQGDRRARRVPADEPGRHARAAVPGSRRHRDMFFFYAEPRRRSPAPATPKRSEAEPATAGLRTWLAAHHDEFAR